MRWRLFRDAWRCLCPQCHQRHIFSGFLSVQKHCSNCRLDLQAQDSGDGPAYTISFILCCIITPLALYSAIHYELDLLWTLLIWSGVTVLLILLLIRPIKSTFIMINYRFINKV